jgi:hypothetical protein
VDEQDDLSFLDARQQTFVRVQRKAGKRFDQLFAEMCRLPPMTEDALRSSLMKSYGLSGDEARFLADMAREADAEAVVRDGNALREAFTYRSFSHDKWQIFCDDPDRPFFEPLRILELPRILAEDFVEECYYERQAWDALTAALSRNNVWKPDSSARLLGHLEEAGRLDLIERYCVSTARTSRSRFFAERAGRNGQASEAWVEKYKDYALEAHDRAIEWMERIGRVETAAELADQREAVREGRLPELPQISDHRRMDEALFWELVARSRSEAETLDEQLMLLQRLLGSFKAGDIKRFGSIYAGYMRRLYHWDVWALAYAARNGCSDDAFVEFRTWLILQGDPTLVALARTDHAGAAERVPRDPELPDGSLSAMIEETYLQRRGRPMTMAGIDLETPKGREWPEEAWEVWYPALARHYSPENLL